MTWLHNLRRIVMHYEYHVENYLGFAHLGCVRACSGSAGLWDEF